MTATPETSPDAPRPTSAELLVLGQIPLIAASFRRVRSEMPEQLRTTFEEYGLSARHGAVLTQLMAGEPASVSELAKRLRLSLSTVSELVGALGRSGLVVREEDPANRRRTLVSFPPGVRAVYEEFVAIRCAPLVRAMSKLSASDRAGFLAGLSAWADEEREMASD
ncbi:MarR family winged helix-turn-helix transcriptional regulator [Saccharopolyspora sp. NPDC003752]